MNKKLYASAITRRGSVVYLPLSKTSFDNCNDLGNGRHVGVTSGLIEIMERLKEIGRGVYSFLIN